MHANVPVRFFKKLNRSTQINIYNLTKISFLELIIISFSFLLSPFSSFFLFRFGRAGAPLLGGLQGAETRNELSSRNILGRTTRRRRPMPSRSSVHMETRRLAEDPPKACRTLPEHPKAFRRSAEEGALNRDCLLLLMHRHSPPE